MLTVVIQGPITKWTTTFATEYAKISCVKNVIISTWKDETISGFNIIYSDKPENPGIGNRNNQIVSSYNGLKAVDTNWTVKIRSDMFLPYLGKMYKFARDNETEKIKSFVLALHRTHPFHPKDYAFIGQTDKLLDIFNIPLCIELPKDIQHNSAYYNTIRTECYIAKYSYRDIEDERINEILNNESDYLLDSSANRNIAMDVYNQCIINREVFVPLPKTDIYWPKHYPNGYPFDLHKEDEIYYEDISTVVCK